MYRFFRDTILFIIPISILLEVFTRLWDGEYERKRDGLIEAVDSIEVLVLGNSHAADGIDPAAFDLYTFNLAFGSQSIYFDTRLALKYLEDLKNLKFVIFTMDYQSRYFLHRSSRDKYYHYFHDIDFQNQRFYQEDISHFLFGYGPKTALRNLSSKERPMYRGWTFHPPYREWKLTADERAIERAAYFDNLIRDGSEMQELIMTDLHQVTKLLTERGITCIFLCHPIHQKLNVHLNPSVFEENETSMMNLLQNPLVFYLDYHTLPMQNTDFYNIDHLNSQGARKYSSILNQILLDLDRNPTPPLPH